MRRETKTINIVAKKHIMLKLGRYSNNESTKSCQEATTEEKLVKINDKKLSTPDSTISPCNLFQAKTHKPIDNTKQNEKI